MLRTKSERFRYDTFPRNGGLIASSDQLKASNRDRKNRLQNRIFNARDFYRNALNYQYL
jgi:hypothetical protein